MSKKSAATRLLKSLAKGRRALDDARAVIEGAGEMLDSGAQLFREASSRVGGAVQLGERIGSDLARGLRDLAKPSAIKVDVKVVDDERGSPKSR